MDVCQHQPNRPFWDCTACGQEWPCGPARAHLLAEAEDSLSLAMLLWTFFEDYSLDLGEGPVPEAFQRFLGWARRPASTAQSQVPDPDRV